MIQFFRFHDAAVLSTPTQAHPGGIPLERFNQANREVRDHIDSGQGDQIRAPYGQERTTADVLATTESFERLSSDVEARYNETRPYLDPPATLQTLRGAVRGAESLHVKQAEDHRTRAREVGQRSLAEQYVATRELESDLPGGTLLTAHGALVGALVAASFGVDPLAGALVGGALVAAGFSAALGCSLSLARSREASQDLRRSEEQESIALEAVRAGADLDGWIALLAPTSSQAGTASGSDLHSRPGPNVDRAGRPGPNSAPLPCAGEEELRAVTFGNRSGTALIQA
ncbi:MAG: hypothetical protein AB1758_20795 [Candidatus Eremiobacterota bacterium]